MTPLEWAVTFAAGGVGGLVAFVLGFLMPTRRRGPFLSDAVVGRAVDHMVLGSEHHTCLICGSSEPCLSCGGLCVEAHETKRGTEWRDCPSCGGTGIKHLDHGDE